MDLLKLKSLSVINPKTVHSVKLKAKSLRTDMLFWVFSALVVIVGYLMLRDLMIFAEQKSPFSFELLAAFLGSIVMAAAMLIMMQLQSRLDKEKDYSKQLFEVKLNIYNDLLKYIFEMDDDNEIEHKEIREVENKVGAACLVAGVEVVSLFSQFVWQLKTYGTVYADSMDEKQKENFTEFVMRERKKASVYDSCLAEIKYNSYLLPETEQWSDIEPFYASLDDLIQALRSDLNVVTGDIKQEVQHFFTVELNHARLIRSKPNLVRERRKSDRGVPADEAESSVHAGIA